MQKQKTTLVPVEQPGKKALLELTEQENCFPLVTSDPLLHPPNPSLRSLTKPLQLTDYSQESLGFQDLQPLHPFPLPPLFLPRVRRLQLALVDERA